jgi:hypothetical protein
MTRGFPSRPVLSAALVLMLLTSFSLAAYVAPTSAEPSQETASNSVSVTNSITIPADEGPGPRFPFSVLDQGAATSIAKTICPSPGSCAGGGSSATLAPGALVDFLVVTSNSQVSPVSFTDFWQSGLVFQNGDGCDAPTSTTAPGFVGQVTCHNPQAVLHFLVSTTAPVPSTARNQACVGSNTTGGVTCSEVTVNIANIATPTPTATVTATPTRTNTPVPGTGTLIVCKALTASVGTLSDFPVGTFTTSPAVTIPDIQVPANSLANTAFCAPGVSIAAGSVTVTETAPAGFTLSSVTVNGVATTPVLNAVTTSVTSGGTTTVTFTNTPNTGTLIVCKQIQILGSGALGGIGGIGGIGGLNPPGPLGGIGFNPLGPVGGPNFGGIGGVGGLGSGLGLQGSTVTFTTPPGGPIIPSITIPVGSLGPICAAGVAVAAGTVAVTEVVPAGFTLNSVTGGTLSGNTGTATITANTTTTLTFINVPINVNIPNFLPILPPPPLQFIPPPPPPLLPPPPPAPAAGARAPAAFPEVPVIPEADSLFLVVGGLVALGGLVGLRSLRRRRDDES